jgi:hypothetical protein
MLRVTVLKIKNNLMAFLDRMLSKSFQLAVYAAGREPYAFSLLDDKQTFLAKVCYPSTTTWAPTNNTCFLIHVGGHATDDTSKGRGCRCGEESRR